MVHHDRQIIDAFLNLTNSETGRNWFPFNNPPTEELIVDQRAEEYEMLGRFQKIARQEIKAAREYGSRCATYTRKECGSTILGLDPGRYMPSNGNPPAGVRDPRAGLGHLFTQSIPPLDCLAKFLRFSAEISRIP